MKLEMSLRKEKFYKLNRVLKTQLCAVNMVEATGAAHALA